MIGDGRANQRESVICLGTKENRHPPSGQGVTCCLASGDWLVSDLHVTGCEECDMVATNLPGDVCRLGSIHGRVGCLRCC